MKKYFPFLLAAAVIYFITRPKNNSNTPLPDSEEPTPTRFLRGSKNHA